MTKHTNNKTSDKVNLVKLIWHHAREREHGRSAIVCVLHSMDQQPLGPEGPASGSSSMMKQLNGLGEGETIFRQELHVHGMKGGVLQFMI